MSRPKKSSTATSPENDLSQDNEQRTHQTSQSSSRQTIYSSVPRRVRPLLLIDDEEIIDTESTIDILPSRSLSQNASGSSLNQNAYARHTLDLLTKYTSPKKKSHQSCSSSTIDDENGHSDDINLTSETKFKRTLSPLNETSQQISPTKRTKSFIQENNNDDDDNNDVFHFLNHQHTKRIESPITTDEIEQQPTKRKPTARKIIANRSTTNTSQPLSIENIQIESCEPIITNDKINLIDQINANCLLKSTGISNNENPSITISNDTYIEQLNIQSKSTISSTSIRSIKQICFDSNDHFSSSSNSLPFDTSNTSISRQQINRTTSTSEMSSKNDCTTEILLPTNIDMIQQLIVQMNSKSNRIDSNLNEQAKQCFYQTISFSSMNRHRSIDNLPKKQILRINRYEIEIIYPIDNDKFSNIYVCDTCLKSFYGSSIAFQRHTAKCLSIHPPGKLIYVKDDLAIFQIGQTNFTVKEQVYMTFLFRLSRLFIDNEKTIDDTKLNQFVYYILCRKDPILSTIQPPIYRFIGYFSKEINQLTQQMLNNFSCLFVVPCLPRANEYNRFLISFSYFLVRSNISTNFIHCSPARPLDNRTFFILQNYWREMFFNYLIYHNHSSIKPLALDTFARQTCIHPRDILLSLSINGFLRRNSTDQTVAYLRTHIDPLMVRSNFDMNNEILFMNMNDEKKMISNEQNANQSHDSGTDEIILD